MLLVSPRTAIFYHNDEQRKAAARTSSAPSSPPSWPASRFFVHTAHAGPAAGGFQGPPRSGGGVREGEADRDADRPGRQVLARSWDRPALFSQPSTRAPSSLSHETPTAHRRPAEKYHQDYYVRNAPRYQIYRALSGRDNYIASVWGESYVQEQQKH